MIKEQSDRNKIEYLYTHDLFEMMQSFLCILERFYEDNDEIQDFSTVSSWSQPSSPELLDENVLTDILFHTNT